MNDKFDITQLSILDFLEKHGFKFRSESGGKKFCSSPFSRDTNWSLCVYPTNSYFDWSTGHGGNILNLVSRMYNISIPDAAQFLKSENKYETYKPNYKQYKKSTNNEEEFDYKRYINTSEKEISQIQAYAASRKITEGYLPGVFFTRVDDRWVRNPSLMFLHQDKNGKICGAKFRKIINQTQKDQSPRFSSRGRLGVYILNEESIGNTDTKTQRSFVKSTILYVVESETSANSLFFWKKERNEPCIVLSHGGVSSPPTELPEKCKGYKTRIIIDYDGNEKLYQERLKLYSHLNAEPIKMILPKGEDINSLYCKNKMYLIEHLLLK